MFFFVSLLVINLAMVLIVPRIEKYSQAAAIEFYENMRNKDCYITTLGFKSYAHFFYTKKPKPINPNYSNIDWLLNGNIDKPAYFVCKFYDADEFLKNHKNIKNLFVIQIRGIQEKLNTTKYRFSKLVHRKD